MTVLIVYTQSRLHVLGASKRQAFPSPGLFVLRPFCPLAFLSVYPNIMYVIKPTWRHDYKPAHRRWRRAAVAVVMTLCWHYVNYLWTHTRCKCLYSGRWTEAASANCISFILTTKFETTPSPLVFVRQVAVAERWPSDQELLTEVGFNQLAKCWPTNSCASLSLYCIIFAIGSQRKSYTWDHDVVQGREQFEPPRAWRLFTRINQIKWNYLDF